MPDNVVIAKDVKDRRSNKAKLLAMLAEIQVRLHALRKNAFKSKVKSTTRAKKRALNHRILLVLEITA
jgi:hypothetical protein